ncbi:hypothetical protein SOVF_093860, partial [Spinacia oleracea]
MIKPANGCCGGGMAVSLPLVAAILLRLLHGLQPSAALPYITIEEFTVSVLKETTNSSNIIHFDLKLRNLDTEPSYYDALNLTFYYKSNLSSFPIGNATFSPFYQREFGRAHRVGNIEVRGVNWENATIPMTFKVVLATAVRSEVKIYWKSRRYYYLVGADLKVNDQ